MFSNIWLKETKKQQQRKTTSRDQQMKIYYSNNETWQRNGNDLKNQTEIF